MSTGRIAYLFVSLIALAGVLMLATHTGIAA